MITQNKIIEEWCKFFDVHNLKDKCRKCGKIHGLNDVTQSDLYKLIEITEKFQKQKIIEEIKDWEKENTEVLKTEDIIKEKIIIADYIKWDKFRELLKTLGEK